MLVFVMRVVGTSMCKPVRQRAAGHGKPRSNRDDCREHAETGAPNHGRESTRGPSSPPTAGPTADSVVDGRADED
jgi:hypothetical protein